jgi:hypothetical protein
VLAGAAVVAVEAVRPGAAEAASGGNVVMGQLNDAGTSATDWTSSNATRTVGVFNSGGGNGIQGNANGSNAAVWGNNDGSGLGVYGSNTTTGAHGSLGGTNGVEGVGASGVVGTATAGTGAAGVVGNVGSGSYGVFGSGGTAIGVYGVGDHNGLSGLSQAQQGYGVFGRHGLAGAGVGYGVWGVSDADSGIGVYGTGGATGVQGVAPLGSGGVGVAATAPESTETALAVTGKATFSRSGIASIKGTAAAPKSQIAVTNIPLTTSSIVLAVVQGASTVGVLNVTLNVAASAFTIHLAQTVTTTVKVGWFVVN